jgi:hypothetical protein
MQGIKYTTDFVIDFYKKNGCLLLEPYVNVSTPLKYQCKCGKISRNNFFYFMKSSYCWDCAAAKQAHTQEYVEEIFKARGCELLDNYKNNRTRMKFLCKCGTISTITLASFQDKECYCEDCGGRKKLTLDYVKNEVSKCNYELLDKNYTKASVKLKMKCDKGHLIAISWNNFQRGKRCKICFIEQNWLKPEDRKFAVLCRSVLKNCLKKTKIKKTDKTEKLLGYDYHQLKNRIINHENWNVIKDKKWHIDHIFPIKAFCDYGIKNIKLINCLENLMPIEGKENLKKSSKYNKVEFEQWLASKGIMCFQ